MQTQVMDVKHKGPLTSLVEPSLSHNTDFIHAGAEDCLGREGAADRLVEIVQGVLIGQVPHCGSDNNNKKRKKYLEERTKHAS